MRLRYLYFPLCGPLVDTEIVFGREDLITKTLALPRKGTLNFIVGVNGTGKSSLLRALYSIFSSLKNKEFPKMPFTLAWDISNGKETVTAFLHIPVNMKEEPFFTVIELVHADTNKTGWLQLTNKFKDDANLSIPKHLISRGNNILGSYLQAHLPIRVFAYTSGSVDMWKQIEHPVLNSDYNESAEYQAENERPHGWNIYKEWDREQPVRIANILINFSVETSRKSTNLPGIGHELGELTVDRLNQLQEELKPLNEIRQKISISRLTNPEKKGDPYIRIQSQHLRYAGFAMALLRAAGELKGLTEDGKREALRNQLLQHYNTNEKRFDDRRVLNKINWFWPTHLSIVYFDTEDCVSPIQHLELVCLVALADEVIAHPQGRNRAVISLGPTNGVSLSERLKGAFPYGLPNKIIEDIVERVDGCTTGAEAVLRIFCAADELDATPLDFFTHLCNWERTGLLENVTLTIKRLFKSESMNEENDDVIVTYEQLSDGEQMLLGRMGLLYLLRGQNGSLLLLDEPETHFNDVWKREIVEMVDMGLLNSTDANVIIATHTSIALTDAFAAEVTVLDKNQNTGETIARGVTGGLFGTDPGEVNMNLFHAESSIGRRSEEMLAQLLETEWKGKENELEKILNVLGSSFHRAELRAILKQLRTDSNGTA